MTENTKPTRVLFVDDDSEDFIMVRDMFKAMPNGSFELDWQADYNDALPQMKRLEHDIYIIDYLLGEHNGLQLIREAFPNGCTMPVILLTARGRRDIDESALAMGVTEYFDKADIRLPLLERAVRYAINNKRIENDLRRNEALFRSLVQSAADYIQVLDFDGKIIQTNQATLLASGYTEADLVGHKLVDFLSKESAVAFNTNFAELLQIGSAHHELEFVHKDGSIRTMEFSCSRVANPDTQRVIVIQHDMTTRKQAERDLRAALEREKELNELKTRFVSMASHELRTPLTAIQTNAYMLKNYGHKMDEENASAKLGKIQDMVQHMSALLDDVLSLSRIVTGQFQFNPTLLQLDQFCKDMVEEFQHGSGKLHKLEFQSQTATIEIPADIKLIRQMVSNLLENAIKYSKPGSTVTTSLTKEGDKAILKVKDLGIGIPESDHATLFDPFRRASNVGEVNGSGLGLSIVKQAVELHSGSITFNTKLGEGTTFIITLPVA